MQHAEHETITHAMTVGIYHIVGDELPPRDMPNTRERVTRYILSQPAIGPDVVHHWVLNRIRSLPLRQSLQNMIRRAPGRNHIVILPPTFTPASYQDDTQLLAAAININAVRNWAVDNGQSRRYDWTIPLDGDCVFSPADFQLFLQQCAATNTEYTGIPMRRCLVSAAGSRDAITQLVEPQLAFARTAKLRFDPTLPFGQADKLELLIRLGFSPVSGRHTELLRTDLCSVASTVDHICMDGTCVANETSGAARNAARLEGLKRLRQSARMIVPTLNPLEELVNLPNGGSVAVVGDCSPQILTRIASRLWANREQQKVHTLYHITNWTDAGMEAALLQCACYGGRVIPVRALPETVIERFDSIKPAAIFVATRNQELQRMLHACYRVLCAGGMLFGTDYDIQVEANRNLVENLAMTASVESLPDSEEKWWRIVKPSGTPIW